MVQTKKWNFIIHHSIFGVRYYITHLISALFTNSYNFSYLCASKNGVVGIAIDTIPQQIEY